MPSQLKAAAWTLGGLLVAVPLVQAQGPPPAGEQRPAPCPVSTDPEFALTPEKAARVGGGAAYVAAREQRYLLGLRGPAGEPISFKRVGQAGARGKDGSILDHYAVTYAGLEKPISIYLDAYHYAEPRAPVGFTCAGFQLGPPPVDPFMATDLQNRLAIEQGSKREFAPIPLGADGSTTYGVAYDRFRLIGSRALAAAKAGTPWDPRNPPGGATASALAIVAYALKCGERTVVPQTIDVVPAQGPPVQRRAGPVSGNELAMLFPAVSLPDGSVGASFALSALRAQDTVRITYGDAICDGTAKEVMLPVVFTPARGVTMPEGTRPATMTGPIEPVWLQAVVDLDGLLQQGSYIGGPDALFQDALAILAQWRAEPARLNRTPVVADTLALIRYK